MSDSSIRFLCVGDVHIKDDNYHMRTVFFERLRTWIIEHVQDFDHVVILGDILDKHEKVNTTYQNQAIDWFKDILECTSESVSLIVLVGNHDMINNQQTCNERGHWMYGIKNLYSRLRIVDAPYVFEQCLFVPYLPPGMFRDTVYSLYSSQHIHGIFAHQEFLNANMESFISSAGDSFDWIESTHWIVSGHIHTRQWVRNQLGEPKVYYTGSALQHSLGDMNTKTICVCTFPSYPPSVMEIDLHVPRRLRYTITPSDLPMWSTTALTYPDNVYTLMVMCSKEEFKLITKTRKNKPTNLHLRHVLPLFDHVDVGTIQTPSITTWSYWEGLSKILTPDESEFVSMARGSLRLG